MIPALFDSSHRFPSADQGALLTGDLFQEEQHFQIDRSAEEGPEGSVSKDCDDEMRDRYRV